MLFQLRTLALGLAVVAGLVVTAAAETTTPLESRGVGQVIFQIDPTPDSPGIQVYHTLGVSTLAGRVTATGITFFTPDGAVQGSFQATSADGETVTGDYCGIWAPVGDATFMFLVETNWHDGSGRFAGITGQSEGVAVLDGLTGAFDWSHAGIWIRP